MTVIENPWHIAAINVRPAWDAGYFGAGVRVGIIDDGFYASNPELKAAYNTAIDMSFLTNLPDATVTSGYSHGTKVDGVISAAADGVGAVGIAPLAEIAGFQIGYGSAGSMSQIVAALEMAGSTCDVVNCSWGYAATWDDNFNTYQSTALALKDGVTNGRGGLGAVFVFSAGNERASGQNVNYHNFANSPYTIAVAGTDQNGVVASWSDPGAALLVSAPGVSIETTTSALESQDATASGTSFSAPIVSGVVALMQEVNPGVNWHGVQEILARTAVKTDPTNAGWHTNGAGLHFSHDYGFGLVDAFAAVNMARGWVNKTANSQTMQGASQVTCTVPTVLQSVSVRCDCAAGATITLVSPSGTTAILARNAPSAVTNWEFTANPFWGENSLGTWTLIGATGFTLTLRGSNMTQATIDTATLYQVGDKQFTGQQIADALTVTVVSTPPPVVTVPPPPPPPPPTTVTPVPTPTGWKNLTYNMKMGDSVNVLSLYQFNMQPTTIIFAQNNTKRGIFTDHSVTPPKEYQWSFTCTPDQAKTVTWAPLMTDVQAPRDIYGNTVPAAVYIVVDNNHSYYTNVSVS